MSTVSTGILADVVAEATDPATAPERLRRLARHRSRPVREAVAGNPNTPFDVLGKIGGAFAANVVGNPLLGWLHVENADFLADFPPIVRQRLLFVAPPGLLWWAAQFGGEQDQLAVLSNADAPNGVVEWLRLHGNPSVQAVAALHVAVTDSVPVGPVALPAISGSEFAEMAALDLIADWLYPGAVASADADIRRAVATLADVPADCVETLAFDRDREVRALARRHPNLPEETGRFLDALDDLDTIIEHYPARILERLLDTADGIELLRRRADLPRSVVDGLVSSTNWTTRQAVAGCPSLYPAAALTLALDTDRDVRHALVSNRACPPQVAALLCSDTDASVRAACPEGARSVVVPLAVVEQLEALGDRGRQLAAGHPSAGATRLVALAGDGDWRVREVVAGNPATPVETMVDLANDHDRDVRTAIAKNPAMPASLAVRLATDVDDRVRGAVIERVSDSSVFRAFGSEKSLAVMASGLANAALPADLVRRFTIEGDTTARRVAAGRPGMPDDLLVELAGDDDDDIRLALMLRGDASDATVARALRGDSHLVAAARQAVTDSASMPTADLRDLFAVAGWLVPRLTEAEPWPDNVVDALVASTDWRVRQKVAQRTNDESILAVLADDRDHDVREAAIRNGLAPIDLIASLAGDHMAPVRRAVLARPDLARDLVLRFMDDADDEVRDLALAHPKCPPAVRETRSALLDGRPVDLTVLQAAATHEQMTERILAARHPETPTDLLDVLSADGFWQVREATAGNPSTPPLLLRRLATDADRDVRRAVAGQPTLPQDLLADLLADSSDLVRTQALSSESVTDAQRQAATIRLVRRAARSASEGARVAAAAAALPPKDLGRRRIAQSIDWWVRYAVATNLDTPREVLERLAGDANILVRTQARSSLEEPA